ncbi:MAG: C10 family peptidase [Bacteroidales bacterium]|nr:C10 family peptidase [Bacteroidales bacterium]
MKKIPICIILVLLSVIGKAQQQVSISTAKTAAINTMRYNRQIYTEADIDTVNLYVSGLDTLLYEVKFNDNHSVLLSGSKACQPILGYNFSYDDETTLDKFDEIPPGLQFMIQEYINQIELCFANDTITLWHASDWANLMSYNRDAYEIFDVISPLISTKWGQSTSNDNYDCHAYNYYVPYTDNDCSCSDKHCPTGCVATAMAQIMNYWKHPVYHPWYGPNQFDWCNMPDKLITISPNYEKERNAVAWLMRICGLKVDMDYCIDGDCSSGAYISDSEDAFENYFQYSSDADFQRKFWHNDNTWLGRIKNNLNHEWPVLYAGGNHAFVCDGYRSDDSFHFNWGWRGVWNDTWLTINNLSFGVHDYNSRQQAVFYIYPANNDDYCHITSSLDHYFRLYRYLDTVSTAAPKIFDTLVSVNRSSTLNPKYRTVANGQNIEYVAHKKVKLIDGFHAEEGSHFSAYIDECEKCEEEDLGVHRNDDKESFVQTEPAQTIADKVYIIPNPNNGSFHLLLSNNEDEITGIKVFDTMGKIIYSNNHFNGGEIVLPNVKQGLYYIVVTLKNKTITEKIIIQ